MKIPHGTKANNKRGSQPAVIPCYTNVLLDLLEYLGSTKSLSIAICLRYFDNVSTEDLKEVLSINYRRYDSVHAYKIDAQAIALLKKTEMFPVRYDTRDLTGFFNSSEALAKLQNITFRHRSFSFGTRSLLERTREIIRQIMGECSDIYGNSRFGPGATYALSGVDATVKSKVSHYPECTPNALEYVETEMYEMRYAHLDACDKRFSIVPGDRFCLVPKDIFKPRCMAPQPGGNMMMQLSVAHRLEKRFYRYSGILLNEQDSVHKEIMYSCPELFATIDLSNASDSISVELCRFLLPTDWFELISDLRSPMTKVNGVWRSSDKMFAQGTGFTFIIESIIFYALATAACEGGISKSINPRSVISVYGDDILVPVDEYYKVVKFLTDIGFAVNKTKSFGPSDIFKESCGVDTINGINVRPIYFKHFTRDEEGFTLLVNGIVLISEFLLGPDLLDKKLKRAINRTLSGMEREGFVPNFVYRTFDRSEGIWVPGNVKTKNVNGTRVRTIYRKYKRESIYALGDTNGSVTLALALLGVESTGFISRSSSYRIASRWSVHNRGYHPGMVWV